jgi:hypothetical protein
VDYQRKDDIGTIVLDGSFSGDFSLSVSFGQNPPDIVKTVCMELVNLFWTRRTSVGIKSMSIGDFKYETNTSLGSEIKDILNMLNEYRDPHFATQSPIYNQNR